MAPVTLIESLALRASTRDSLAAAHPEFLDGRSPLPSPDSLALSLSSSSSRSTSSLFDNSLAKRQSSSNSDSVVVPATYPGISPGANGGEVAGITLGVVFGVILLLWLVNSLINTNRNPVLETSSVTDNPDRAYRRSRSRTNRTRSSRRTRSRSVATRSEMSEAPRPPPRSPRRARETVVIEETRREPSRVRPVSRPREVIEDEDIIEVIEEHSPPRRPRRMSGYRNVDPEEYAGGSRPMRKVRR